MKIFGIIICLIVALAGVYLAFNPQLLSLPTPYPPSPLPNPNQTVCTQEAMQCPDGSYVGRTGPNCAFTKCPTVNGNKPPIVEVFACSDYCPGPREKYLVKVYQGVSDENQCKSLGGIPYTYTGWMEYHVCKVSN